ncbi:putative [histone H3]-dimethyl-L-lysine(36) demethylase [Helianthus debilis subsp. tardiflorus]
MREVEVPNWLKELPLAPVFYPTDTEFSDPIAYISKIEKEASVFGICKVVPPLPKPSKKYVVANLNKSLLKCPELGSDVKVNNAVNDGEARAVFTTRHQELGHNKRTKEVGSAAGLGSGSGLGSGQLYPPVVNKQVWQSGEIYTLDQFESKSRAFARSQLGMVKDVSPLDVESLFWKAACEKPIYIEYANDVPGSGFGEPVGPTRFLRKHRRRRGVDRYKYNTVCSDTSEQVDDKVNDFDSRKGESVMCSSSSSVNTLKKDTDLLNNEIEGSSGWKLSNCPWNLQVIARSPGSLTRFMPDDIPGVTSPMVYIGMLFSWFAWHVEDHELHSLNFLHIGSPKTWYAVPGDYAFTFEEVIRSKAYGDIDRLAALTLLGEKTTLLSPETVVASGIPCCRLVQNPGEFVVTFPRAYHIGFSHGFNCGEAANFATPKWLSVAKEAAVRRAAMNFLPMLSHQQLLYLLTMSFIPRVPRSLLPGMRTSRLKDRQKDERELLVKKEFIDDILNENKLLNCILRKNPSYRAVRWDLESLSPFVNKENVHVENNSNLGVDTIVHIEDDDMSSDFQFDSGSLPCVACGVLGYPFMSVIQPSSKAVIDDFTVTGHGAVQAHEGETETKSVDVDNGWNMCSGYLRPRIFCLEHVSKIEELLKSTGGAKLLIICHSDFQKIKAQASVIAEQIGTAFRYNDVQVDDATRDDLDLINLAIDNEQEDDEYVEDWTSKLNVNIRQSVKFRPKLSADKIHHALNMDALFSDTIPNTSVGSHAMNFKWQATKSRSNKKSNQSIKKLPKTVSVENDVEFKESVSEAQMLKKGGTLIQYKRRIFKSKPQDPKVNLQNELVTKNDSVVHEMTQQGSELTKLDASSADEPVTVSDVRVEKGKLSDVYDENTPASSSTSGSKRKREAELLQKEEKSTFDGFIKSPCEGLRPRSRKDSLKDGIFIDTKTIPEKPTKKSKVPGVEEKLAKKPKVDKNGRGSHKCDRDGCKMSFKTKAEVNLHRKNMCPHEGCGKKFTSHRYAVLHLRIHDDDRPLKCTWKGCKMTFKWAWALTEHLRVHTGERPYKCKVEGCGLTFRFVSDFSRHRRKTGHNVTVKS